MKYHELITECLSKIDLNNSYWSFGKPGYEFKFNAYFVTVYKYVISRKYCHVILDYSIKGCATIEEIWEPGNTKLLTEEQKQNIRGIILKIIHQKLGGPVDLILICKFLDPTVTPGDQSESEPVRLRIIREYLSKILSRREYLMLVLHYFYEFSLDDISKRFELTRERVRQIIRKAEDKLRISRENKTFGYINLEKELL